MSDGEITERSDPELFGDVLEEAVGVAEDNSIPYAVFGSIAASHWGRPTPSGDIDLFVREHDAARLHELLGENGFKTETENAKWLLKGWRDGVLVDLIFKVRGDIYFDEEMQRHTARATYLGRTIDILSAEDTLLVEALSNEYETPDHWFNAVAILAKQDLDWDYLLQRARVGTRRILSLLVYAQSTDVPVPDRYVRELYRTVYEQEA